MLNLFHSIYILFNGLILRQFLNQALNQTKKRAFFGPFPQMRYWRYMICVINPLIQHNLVLMAEGLLVVPVLIEHFLTLLEETVVGWGKRLEVLGGFYLLCETESDVFWVGGKRLFECDQRRVWREVAYWIYGNFRLY